MNSKETLKSKKLITAKSPMHCFPHHGFTLNILFLYKQHIPWFLTNYIQTNWLGGNNGYHIFSPGCLCEGIPFFETQKIEIDYIKRNNISIIDFIIDAINTDSYVSAFFNEKYLLYSSFEGDYVHHIFISGYDMTTKTFNMMGFKNGIYGEVTASFDEVEKSFVNLPALPHIYTKYAYTVKPKKNIRFDFDLYGTYDWLLDYVYSRDSSHKETLLEMKTPEDLYSRDSANKEAVLSTKENNNAIVWGMNSYNELKKNFEDMLKNKSYVSVRDLHTLWEHKKAMQMRMEYMNQNKYIHDAEDLINSYKNVVEKSLKARNLLMKCTVTRNAKNIESILENLCFIENEERIILKKLLNKIQQNLYSERILNSVANIKQEKSIPLLSDKKYMTIIYECHGADDETLLSQRKNDFSGNNMCGWILKENKYNDILKNNNTLPKDTCLIIESENADNIYSKSFKSEYFKIYADDKKSNLSIVTVDDIDNFQYYISNYSSKSKLSRDFVVIYIKNSILQMKDRPLFFNFT